MYKIKNINKRIVFKKLKLKEVKNGPGVYVLFNRRMKSLYVGKSVSLKTRLSYYFSEKVDAKTRKLKERVYYFSTIDVASEIEALLLEAKLVKKYKPYFNVQLKDDKNPLYIKITDEPYPRIKTARKYDIKNNLSTFGPFPSSKNVREILRIIRKMIPFSDHEIRKRPCLYSQIGLCNPCPNYIANLKNSKKRKIETKSYIGNIKKIQKVLKGEIPDLKKLLIKKMHAFSKNKRYEEAALIRDQIEKLEYITRPSNKSSLYLENPGFIQEVRKNETDSLKRILNKYYFIRKLDRIECYDVSHIAGSFSTASMVTFIKGEPEKKLYRHFKIKKGKKFDDYSALDEVLTRRIKYLDSWGKPDLVIVDGGKGQITIFKKILTSHKIPVIGLAKKNEHIIIPTNKGFRIINSYDINAGNLLKRARDEAHRFARRYHLLLFKKNMVSQMN